MLNVLHQRSDIANWFVEGGSHALAQLSGYDRGEEALQYRLLIEWLIIIAQFCLCQTSSYLW
jgi:hypothetical protein